MSLPPMPPVADKVLAGEESLKTVARTVQWRIDIPTVFNQKSRCGRTFKFGNCAWSLELKERKTDVTSGVYVMNYTTNTAWKSLSKNYTLNLSVLDCVNRCIDAQFVLRIAHSDMTWQTCFTTVGKQCFRSRDCSFEHELNEIQDKRLVIDFEFGDLNITRSNDQKLVAPESLGEERPRVPATQGPLNCLSRMFTESIHADVTINTKNGTLDAHRAVLAASSPVFACMFDNNFKEKSFSTIDIQDMSFETCKAFLSYLYGELKEEELWVHRHALLEAAHKYGIVMLQNVCEENLIEDINLSNVLERLSEAHFYELKNLKKGCFTYLFDLGRVYFISDGFSSFILNADRELVKEIIWTMLAK